LGDIGDYTTRITQKIMTTTTALWEFTTGIPKDPFQQFKNLKGAML
jgi:hypothetical protein